MEPGYTASLLKNWESIFRQGMLTFWVFIAIHEDELATKEIVQRVATLTNNTYLTSEQTIYRLLRKHYDLELVDFREIPGNSGPNKKLYRLSPIGKKLLHDFTKRNIRLFQQPVINNI